VAVEVVALERMLADGSGGVADDPAAAGLGLKGQVDHATEVEAGHPQCSHWLPLATPRWRSWRQRLLGADQPGDGALGHGPVLPGRLTRRVTPAGQVAVPATSSTVKSSIVNAPVTAGRSGPGLMTAARVHAGLTGAVGGIAEHFPARLLRRPAVPARPRPHGWPRGWPGVRRPPVNGPMTGHTRRYSAESQTGRHGRVHPPMELRQPGRPHQPHQAPEPGFSFR
jgi:hypothetical protein